MLTLRAYAKLNLTLEVLGRRDDGFHDIATIMQSINISDTLTFERSESLTLECDVPDLSSSDNLVIRAAVALRRESGYEGGAHITLAKEIPIAAGLGGGSSDAATTLLGLNKLWDLGWSKTDLGRIATEIGSDVSFFLHGGTAAVYGRGERVRVISAADIKWFVVVAPAIVLPNKTATLYKMLDATQFTRGALTRKLEARIRGDGDVPPQLLFNVFDNVAFKAYEGLEVYWNTLESMGVREIHLAGSGPTLFAPLAKREVGTAVQLLLKHKHGWDARLAAAWQPAIEVRDTQA